jgi:hypothetical protein
MKQELLVETGFQVYVAGIIVVMKVNVLQWKQKSEHLVETSVYASLVPVMALVTVSKTIFPMAPNVAIQVKAAPARETSVNLVRVLL